MQKGVLVKPKNKMDFLPTRKSEKNFILFYRPTDPYFSHDLPVEQQIKFVSP